MNYEDIFQERGGSYHEAMKRWPEVRRNDFILPLRWAALQAGEKVLDVPAGGGYMRKYVPAACQWFGHEPCASFGAGATTLNQSLLPLPYADGFAHAAISIAGVHHLSDKPPLFGELHRVLRPGGRLMLADVHADSSVARFLDDFVGRHNSTGHRGEYLNEQTLEDLKASGFSIDRAERVRYEWCFADRSEMGAFCHLLFDIREIDVSEVADAIEQHLGLRAQDKQIGMQWELYFILAVRDGKHRA